MKNGLLNILFIGLLFLFSQKSYAETITGKAVSIQILDKVTSKIENITIDVGDSFIFGTIKIKVFLCKKRPPEEVPEDFVLIRIFDETSLGKFEKIFQGWMISSSPSITPFEHPTYDVWVKDCKINLDSE